MNITQEQAPPEATKQPPTQGQPAQEPRAQEPRADKPAEPQKPGEQSAHGSAAQSPSGGEPDPRQLGFRERGKMRRRLRFLRAARELSYRDLGGLLFDLHRFGGRRDELISAKLARLGQIDAEARALERAINDRRKITVLREAGVVACARCAAIHSSEDRFCPHCGFAAARDAERPLATSAPAPAALASPAPASPAGPPTQVHAPLAPPSSAMASSPAPPGVVPSSPTGAPGSSQGLAPPSPSPAPERPVPSPAPARAGGRGTSPAAPEAGTDEATQVMRRSELEQGK